MAFPSCRRRAPATPRYSVSGTTGRPSGAEIPAREPPSPRPPSRRIRRRTTAFSCLRLVARPHFGAISALPQQPLALVGRHLVVIARKPRAAAEVAARGAVHPLENAVVGHYDL